jgi:CelD/BcsL family acetyltransferase involved in cellulose biosynthesis
LRLVLLKEIPEDAQLREQWNSLVQGTDRAQVFYTYEWALAVERAYLATLRPLIFLAYDERDSLCAVAALATDVEEQKASFLCATTGDYCDFVTLPEYKSSFVAAVLDQLREHGIDDITLTNLPADSDTVNALRSASKLNRYHYFARTAYVCAQVSLDQLERRAGEKNPILPRKKMLRRFLNAMGRETPVRLDHARTWNVIEPILPQFTQAHIARFLVTGRISNLARPERHRFLEELAKLLADSGWITVTRMMSGQKAFAWNYGFQFKDTWFWYQPTFDSDFEKYSPGFCLLAKLIEEAAENPTLKTLDLGLGAEEYKERFANQSRNTLYVTLRSSLTRHQREVWRYGFARVIKSSPRVERGVRMAMALSKRLADAIRRKGFAATLQSAAKRASGLMRSRTEVYFLEWNGGAMWDAGACRLQSLDIYALAAAASQFIDDEETLAYLLRCAARLRDGRAEGFGLIDSSGRIVHFAWVTAFDGFFLSELNAKVEAPSSNCLMIFDCWTPISQRGHGYYGKTVSLLGSLMEHKSKRAWIFSAAENRASIRGLQKAGFQRRYSLVRRITMGVQTLQKNTFGSTISTPELPASA